MALLDKLKGFEHTFTGWFAKEYTKLWAAEPKIEEVSDTVFKYAVPALQIVATIEAGAPAGAMVGAVAREAQKDLHAAGALIYDFGPNPSATAIIKGVQQNLGGLLVDGHVKNENSAAGIKKVINTLGALIAALPAAETAIAQTAAA